MPTDHLIFDAHLDLAWNALSFNRDLTLEVGEIRHSEQGMTDELSRGRGTVSLPELRKAGVAVCVGTILARSPPEQKFQAAGYKRTDLDHVSQAVAYAVAQGQLAYYFHLERQGQIKIVRTKRDLTAHWDLWRSTVDRSKLPVGVILSMEGTDPITEPQEAQAWWSDGLRAAGLAHYGLSHYAGGTGTTGPLTPKGAALLKEFERLSIAMDVTHLCDRAMAQALDTFSGHVLASHHNSRTLVPHERQLADDQIRRLIERESVIGMAYDAWMLHPGWHRGVSNPECVSLEASANHVDHICQMAGNANHVAIGSDLDGGFGTEQTPRELQTISDLWRLAEILSDRGYNDPDIGAIFHGNWLRFFSKVLPA